jgi:predicted hydrocarbon binding protein
LKKAVAMSKPEVDIDVDPESGIWRTDGLPMLYLPRHFFVNNHVAVEEALGLDTYRGILRTATDKSAVHWCKSVAKTLNLSPIETFHRYFQRLSQRGWGQFEVKDVDIDGQCGQIDIRNSIFVLEQHGAQSSRALCYMFEGFMTGALRFLLDADDAALQVECTETHCAAMGDSHCQFEFASPL